MALKFGSKAWRAKYLKNGPKRKRKTKRKTAKRTNRKRPASRKRTTNRGRTRLLKNPPRKWTTGTFRVIKRSGKDILEVKKKR